MVGTRHLWRGCGVNYFSTINFVIGKFSQREWLVGVNVSCIGDINVQVGIGQFFLFMVFLICASIDCAGNLSVEIASNGTLERSPFTIKNVQEHSMGTYLYDYLDIKVHDWIQKRDFKNIWIVGEYSRGDGISQTEKKEKIFNYQRPTAKIQGDDLYVQCFPGIDYVQHYASLISSFLALHQRNFNNVHYLLPNESVCWEVLLRSNLMEVPHGDVAILGYGLDILAGSNQHWEGKGSFSWVTQVINHRKVVFIGCRHSYWGDIGGRIVTILAKMGYQRVIFVGKLGTMRSEIAPNTLLATGDTSFIHGEIIHWKNCFDFMKNDPGIVFGNHIHVASVMFETKNWVKKHKNYDFVDPEIGYMAKAAIARGIEFSFLHIISDNLSKKYEENLSNERGKKIIEKRHVLLNKIKSIIEDSMLF